MGDVCVRQVETGCVGEIENIENVCTMVPNLNSEGVLKVGWALRTLSTTPEKLATLTNIP